MIFLDTSAIARMLFSEPGASAVAAAVRDESIWVVSEIARVEFESALRRRVRERTVTAAEAKSHAARFAEMWATLHRVPTTSNVIDVAQSLPARYPLRTLDALQLASAIVVREDRGMSSIVFASCDDRLNEAAACEGFRTVS